MKKFYQAPVVSTYQIDRNAPPTQLKGTRYNLAPYRVKRGKGQRRNRRAKNGKAQFIFSQWLKQTWPHAAKMWSGIETRRYTI